jgi:hypothetical protein
VCTHCTRSECPWQNRPCIKRGGGESSPVSADVSPAHARTGGKSHMAYASFLRAQTIDGRRASLFGTCAIRTNPRLHQPTPWFSTLVSGHHPSIWLSQTLAWKHCCQSDAASAIGVQRGAVAGEAESAKGSTHQNSFFVKRRPPLLRDRRPRELIFTPLGPKETLAPFFDRFR